MNIIIPMAGIGKRLRPHTLTTAKPLLPIAGKPIVHRLVEDIAKVCPEKIDIIGFILHPGFGKQVEEDLIAVAKEVGAQGRIYYQEEALGISHALLFAKEIITGKVIIAFADTLFRTNFILDTSCDGIIWVQQVEDPSQFGVVKVNTNNEITELVEKPTEFVSDLAIIGIYFFRDGELLQREMQYLIDHDILEKGEYQFTTALERMKKAGAKFVPGQVEEWLDCGNKNAMVDTNKRYLEFIKDQPLVSATLKLSNSIIIPPCFIGEGVVIENSVIGPHASIGDYSKIRDSRITNSIIQKNCSIHNAVLDNSMLGNFVNFEGNSQELSLGDYSTN
ncbi:MAG: nucleotidyltransferase [Cyclobacteriaceae bacterium]|nr:nucleotidyltransferase [Cyclobacteriaceae bacterium]